MRWSSLENKQLTQNFHTFEFGQNLPEQVVQNYYLLCLLVLEFIRNKFGVVKITSGYREPQKNAAVGGVKDSQHTLGEAVDFICPYAPNGMGEVFSYIRDTLKWQGECLWYKRRGHIHIALPRYDVKADFLILDK